MSTNACKPATNTSGMDKTKVSNCQSYQVRGKSVSAVVNVKVTLNTTEGWGQGPRQLHPLLWSHTTQLLPTPHRRQGARMKTPAPEEPQL